MSEIEHNLASDENGTSGAQILFVAVIASVLGGVLPGYWKMIGALPVLLLGLGVLGSRPYLSLMPAILFCPFNFESLIARIPVPFVNPFNLAWLLATGTLVFVNWRNRESILQRTKIDKFLITNLAVSTLAVIQSLNIVPDHAYSSILMTYQQWAQWLVFFWVVAGLVRGVEQGRLVVLALGFMILVAGLFGIKDYILTRAVSGGAIERSQGLFGQANYAASFFAYYLPIIASVAMIKKYWFSNLFLIVSLLVGTVACVMTFGRGGLLAAGVAFVVLAVLKRSKKLILILVLGAMIISTDPTIRARFSETTSNSTSKEVELDDSSGARLIAWEKAIDLASKRPLIGYGFLSFRHIAHPLDREAAARFGHGRMDVHNGHLNTLVSGGLIGSLALYGQFLGIIFWCYRITKASSNPFCIALAQGIIASVVAIMVVNMFGTRLYDRQLVGYFWMFLGVLQGAEFNSNTEQDKNLQ